MVTNGAASRIESLGVYLPARVESTADLMARVRHRPVLDVEALTGITHRRVRGESEDSLTLAVSAARDCLRRSAYAADDIDAIVYAGIARIRGRSRHVYDPSMALQVKQAIGSRARLCFDVNNACTGMLTGVHVLDSLIRSGAVRNGLIVSGEPNSIVVEQAVREIARRHDPQYAALTVGDAGAAVVLDAAVDPAERIHRIKFYTFAEFCDLCTVAPSEANAGWAFYTNMIRLHLETITRATPSLRHAYAGTGADFDADFDVFVPHQVSVKGIQSGILMHRIQGVVHGSPEVLYCVREFGNTSTTSHFVALHQALGAGRVAPGHRLLLLGYASGISIGFVDVTVGALGAR
jgi:3-oxoacyl-[acyl-carrier-protein] synthase III